MSSESKPLPKWTENFFHLIHKHWEYHAPCEHINIKASLDRNSKCWLIQAAPVYQEVYGGDEDGKKVWSGFLFDVGDFSKEIGVWVQEYAIASYCQECTDHPKIMIKGKFQGHQFYLNVFLEPVAETEPVEIIDTIEKQIREVPQKEDR